MYVGKYTVRPIDPMVLGTNKNPSISMVSMVSTYMKPIEIKKT